MYTQISVYVYINIFTHMYIDIDLCTHAYKGVY